MASHASRKGFPLAAKLISGFLLVAIPSLAVMAAISLHALWDLASANRELHEISRSLEAVQRLETAVARSVTPLSAYLVDGASGHDQQFKDAMGEVEARLAGCGSGPCHGASPQPVAMAKALAPHVQAIKERAAVVFAAGGSSDARDKIVLLHQVNQQGDEAYRRLERMSSTLLARVTSLQEKSSDLDRRASGRILVTVALVLALAAAGAWLLSRRLLRHVGELLIGTRKITEGELGYRVAVAQRDEIGELARSFNAMAQEIQDHRENLSRAVEARTAELKQAQHSLVQSEKLASIGLLASGVAHELNNPLTSILMNVNLLAEDAQGQPELLAELRRIETDTQRCKRIIDDLRDFSRRYELDVAPADLNALVHEALEQLGRGTGLKGIAVKCELDREIPPVPFDRARMEQVLGNVLANAVQAMPQGGELAVRTALRPGGAEISVQDTGEGIAEAIRGRIFDPFFTTKPQGTGLGLSIVYTIMQAHGGRVEVLSASRADALVAGSPRQGTRMILLLPLAAAPVRG